MRIIFHYVYTLFCTACNRKIHDVDASSYTNDQTEFEVTNTTCPNCGVVGEINVIKAETKSFS